MCRSSLFSCGNFIPAILRLYIILQFLLLPGQGAHRYYDLVEENGQQSYKDNFVIFPEEKTIYYLAKCLWRLREGTGGENGLSRDLTKRSSWKSFYHRNGIYYPTDLFSALDCEPLEPFPLVPGPLQAYDNGYAATTQTRGNDHLSLFLMIIIFFQKGSQFCKSREICRSILRFFSNKRKER